MQSGGGHGGGTPGGKNSPPANLSLVSGLYYDNYAYSPSLTSIPGQSQEEVKIFDFLRFMIALMNYSFGLKCTLSSLYDFRFIG